MSNPINSLNLNTWGPEKIIYPKIPLSSQKALTNQNDESEAYEAGSQRPLNHLREHAGKNSPYTTKKYKSAACGYIYCGGCGYRREEPKSASPIEPTTIED